MTIAGVGPDLDLACLSSSASIGERNRRQANLQLAPFEFILSVFSCCHSFSWPKAERASSQMRRQS